MRNWASGEKSVLQVCSVRLTTDYSSNLQTPTAAGCGGEGGRVQDAQPDHPGEHRQGVQKVLHRPCDQVRIKCKKMKVVFNVSGKKQNSKVI